MDEFTQKLQGYMSYLNLDDTEMEKAIILYDTYAKRLIYDDTHMKIWGWTQRDRFVLIMESWTKKGNVRHLLKHMHSF